MQQEDLEEFAKLLMQWVRDPSVRSCDSSLLPEARDPVSSRWRAAAQGGSTPPGVVIPDCVDVSGTLICVSVDSNIDTVDLGCFCWCLVEAALTPNGP